MLPPSDKLSICFAHVAYRLHERFSALDTGISSFAVRDLAGLEKRVGEAHVLVISGLWQNSLLDRAKKLRFIQSIGAGTDQFPRDELAKRGIRLASARGVNAQAVAEHAMALILALSRRLPEARDNQAKRVWRGVIGDLAEREDELGGKTLLVVGLGDIGGRLRHLCCRRRCSAVSWTRIRRPCATRWSRAICTIRSWICLTTTGPTATPQRPMVLASGILVPPTRVKSRYTRLALTSRSSTP
jgi:phosphoglycerate dehydrogenase-like enzyme